jgi:hypothetical protein
VEKSWLYSVKWKHDRSQNCSSRPSRFCGHDSNRASARARRIVVVIVVIVVHFIIAAHATYHNECLKNKGCCAFGGEVFDSCCIVAFL